jgi:membrane protease YdiL (CAAX protease family)
MNRTLFAERHPYWFTMIMEVLVILVYLVAGTIAHFLGLSNLWLYGLANLGLSVGAAVLLTTMRWWGTVGFRAPRATSDLWYFLLPLLPIVLNLIPGVEVSSAISLIGVFAMTLMVGFVEESFFRGLMLNALRSRGLWKAAIISSLLFGLTHAMNGLTGRDAVQVGAQICYAVAIGFAFAALVLRTGIIWPLVLTHFLIDFANFIQKPGFTFSPEWQLVIVLGMTVIYTGYGLFLMLHRPAETAPRGEGQPRPAYP